MKKIFLTLAFCILATIAVTKYARSEKFAYNMVKDIEVSDIKINNMEISNNTFYYSKLNDNQKKYYRVIANGVMSLDKNITMEITKENNFDVYKNNIEISLTAFLNDHPEVFFVGDKYEVLLIDGLAFKILSLKLEYTSEDINEIHKMGNELKKQIDLINSKITSANTDYEKELLIHDLIATDVSYYKYQDYDDIPVSKHTAYGALVDKSAVCDGITKAFQLVLGQNNIESIFVTGTTENEAHAWCKVKLDSAYYNVDVTSDKTLNSQNKNLIVHSYFNVTDEEILKTHIMDKKDELPECKAVKLNYYVYNDYLIGTLDNFEYKLKKIIQSQNNKPLLEINIEGISNVSSKLVQSLYDLNFNNYKTNNVTKISYNKINDNYIIVK